MRMGRLSRRRGRCQGEIEMKLLEKILTASDKTVVTVALVVSTLVVVWTLAMVDEMTFEVVAMIVLYAWQVIETVTFEEEE